MLFLKLIFLVSPAFAEIPHLSLVEPGFYRGGRPGRFAELAPLGVRTDIDLQGGDLENPYFSRLLAWWEPGETEANIALEKLAAETSGVAFYNLRMNSLAPVSVAEDARVDQILALLGDATKRPVFLHCEHGKDRTGLIVALYRVKFQHWTPAAARAEWARLGHGGFARRFTGDLDTYFDHKVKEFSPPMSKAAVSP